jgi:hypothetical protein
MTRRSVCHIAGLGVGGFAVIFLSACAGDLGAARDSAGKAATFVGGMQKATQDAIDQQQTYHQMELTRASELQARAQMNIASVNEYPAIWGAANLKDPQEIYKSISAMTADADLPKSAPFVMMAPIPAFAAPAVDSKTFSDLISKFNKLSQRLSPIDRATALAPFVPVLVKSFGDSVKGAKAAKPLVAAKSNVAGAPDIPLAQTLTSAGQTLTATGTASSGTTPQPVEELTNNTAPISALLSTLNGQ